MFACIVSDSSQYLREPYLIQPTIHSILFRLLLNTVIACSYRGFWGIAASVFLSGIELAQSLYVAVLGESFFMRITFSQEVRYA